MRQWGSHRASLDYNGNASGRYGVPWCRDGIICDRRSLRERPPRSSGGCFPANNAKTKKKKRAPAAREFLKG